MRLSEMRKGQSGKIVRIGGEIRLRRRILEMGLTRGSEIYVEKYAPLKDPLELVVRGCHISLRVNEAAEIDVEATEPAGA
ncbi:MAG: FeoA family protein [Desulfosalsimonadaceae bacterium]|nr:FeoA family protein [Desulfosalsimonadaceae bacterium]